MRDGHKISRRESFGIAGAAGAAYLLAGPRGAVSHFQESDAAVAAAAKKCLRLTPEQEEGPYYVNVNMVRRDIRESMAGVPLLLNIRVIDVKSCKPIHNAALDIWHCNASGVYSDEAVESTVGQTFLRGIQFTNRKGVATFQTVYPGYYQGRATHIHVKVHTGSRHSGSGISGGHVAHTGQLFADDAISTEAYANSAYAADTAARVPNSADSVYTAQGGSRSLLKLTGDPSSGFAAKVDLGVNPRLTPAAVGGNAGGGGAPPSGGGPGGAPPGP